MDVISLFTTAYTNRGVDTWRTSWSAGNSELVDPFTVAGRSIKKYSLFNFVGIEFGANVPANIVDASTMTGIHVDVWSPNPAATLEIQLVNDATGTAAIGKYQAGQIATGSWVSLNIPLSSFAGLTAKNKLQQMLFVAGGPTVLYLDNVYFYRSSGAPTAPATAAPTPSYTAANAIALFSNAYTSNGADTWSADWDQADVADVKIGTDDVKRYSNVVFAGIEFISKQINASTMTHFSMDIWTPDATAAPAIFKVKLVDFGTNGAFGGGDDSEHEVTLTATSTPALGTGSWVTLNIPFTAFPGLTARAHLAQLIFSGDLKTVYVDNVLVHK